MRRQTEAPVIVFDYVAGRAYTDSQEGMARSAITHRRETRSKFSTACARSAWRWPVLMSTTPSRTDGDLGKRRRGGPSGA
jgi:hypothetical protein